LATPVTDDVINPLNRNLQDLGNAYVPMKTKIATNFPILQHQVQNYMITTAMIEVKANLVANLDTPQMEHLTEIKIRIKVFYKLRWNCKKCV
jgi:hypothetical protein